MGGGLLNLIAYGNKNIILNGNPSKSFFKTSYAKYTNFGLQKFRIDFQGQKVLRENTNSSYEFVVPLYGDFLMDTYFVINMPHIWSPIYCPNVNSTSPNVDIDGECCQPYEFKWIENLGSQLIKMIRFTIGGKIIQEFSGDYLYSMVQRDFSKEKKVLYNEMTGHNSQMNDPANYNTNNGNYPNYLGQAISCEPSIRGRQLYIPLNIWSTLLTKLAIPLVCLQKNQLKILIECRPIRELFVVRDINHYILNQWSQTAEGGFEYIADVSYSEPPYISTMNIVDPKYQMYLFLTQLEDGSTLFPALRNSGVKFDSTKQSTWDADPHLIATYSFIGPEESRQFIQNPPSYLIKQVIEHDIQKASNASEKIRFKTTGLTASWMWFFRRDDAYIRNQWSNYSNWEYNNIPYPCINMLKLNKNTNIPFYPKPCPLKWSTMSNKNNPYQNCQPYSPYSKYGDPSGNIPYITGPTHLNNKYSIMNKWSFIIDGSIRESELSSGVLDSIEKYVRTAGNAKEGIYCYNFCLNTDPFQYQPTGAMNLSTSRHCEWEYKTFKPEYDVSAQLLMVCDQSENMVGYNKINWQINEYNYLLHIMEERYNLLQFVNNNIILKYFY